MEEKIYGDVKSVIADLAEGLQVGAEHVYAILVKQQVVESITYLIIGFISIMLIYLSVKFGKTDWNEPNGKNVASITLGIVGAFSLLITFFLLPDIITGFVNPEYGAIKDILSAVGK